jgi:hypothetical protein
MDPDDILKELAPPPAPGETGHSARAEKYKRERRRLDRQFKGLVETSKRAQDLAQLARAEEDAVGNVRTSEGYALRRMQVEKQRALSDAAYKILQEAGFNGLGLKKGKKRPGL